MRSKASAIAALGAVVLAVSLPPALASARYSAQGTAPACGPSTLVTWLDTAPGGAAAGSEYYNIDFTNLGAASCTLNGFPGISAIGVTGRQLGAPAGWEGAHAPVTLRPTFTAHSQLQVADVGDYGPSCGNVWAASLQVYAPGQTAAKTVPFAFRACNGPGIVYMHTEAVEAGA